MNIVVLAGGLSYEREVSLSSACEVAKTLRSLGHQATVLDVYLGTKIKSGNYVVDSNVPNLEELKKSRDSKIKGLFGENVLKLCQEADLVFIMLHGADGENGKIQATFDLLEIKYTGTNHLGSALALNKQIAKDLMNYHHVKTPKGIIVKSENDEMTIPLPVVVKPQDGGSSIGTSIAFNKEDYKKAVALSLQYNDEVLVEQYIKGRELSVGILKDEVLPVIEIIPLKDFYNYENKYQVGFTDEVCPANLSKEQTKEVQDIALKVHQILKLKDYSRIDFILSENNEFYCLEANTVPGMTPTSLLPTEAKAAGYSFEELCKMIIN